MRIRFAPVVILLFILTSLPAFAQREWGRPRPPRAGACFYGDTDFRGTYFCMKAGERWPSVPAGFNDRITSIRVFGGARLRVFNAANFGSVSLLVDQDLNDLRRVPIADNPSKTWNDRISSIAVFRDRDEWEGRDHDRDHDHDRDRDRDRDQPR